MIREDRVREKLYQELREKVSGDVTFEKIQDLSYFMMVFNETIRLEPPILFSSLMVVTEETEISGIKIRPKDNILVNFHQLHHDPDQW